MKRSESTVLSNIFSLPGVRAILLPSWVLNHLGFSSASGTGTDQQELQGWKTALRPLTWRLVYTTSTHHKMLPWIMKLHQNQLWNLEAHSQGNRWGSQQPSHHCMATMPSTFEILYGSVCFENVGVYRGSRYPGAPLLPSRKCSAWSSWSFLH